MTTSPTTMTAGGRTSWATTVPARAGQPATDAEIEAGTFQVSATVSGEPWWVALEMVPGDVHVEAPGA